MISALRVGWATSLPDGARADRIDAGKDEQRRGAGPHVVAGDAEHEVSVEHAPSEPIQRALVELVQIVDGSATLHIMTEDGPKSYAVSAGMMVVPKGRGTASSRLRG
jgi:hypothetical protein